MKRLLDLLPTEDIKVLTMDREFLGSKWLQWLDKKGVKYIVRIKINVLINGIPAAKYRRGKKLCQKGKVSVWDTFLFFAGCKIRGKNTRDDYLFLVSNYYYGKESSGGSTKMRWGIEQVFSHFKKRGFDLETTHMSDDQKIEGGSLIIPVLCRVLTVGLIPSGL